MKRTLVATAILSLVLAAPTNLDAAQKRREI
jgi:hypothetical protein